MQQANALSSKQPLAVVTALAKNYDLRMRWYRLYSSDYHLDQLLVR